MEGSTLGHCAPRLALCPTRSCLVCAGSCARVCCCFVQTGSQPVAVLHCVAWAELAVALAATMGIGGGMGGGGGVSSGLRRCEETPLLCRGRRMLQLPCSCRGPSHHSLVGIVEKASLSGPQWASRRGRTRSMSNSARQHCNSCISDSVALMVFFIQRRWHIIKWHGEQNCPPLCIAICRWALCVPFSRFSHASVWCEVVVARPCPELASLLAFDPIVHLRRRHNGGCVCLSLPACCL